VQPDRRIFTSAHTGALLRLTIGLGRHSGDWDSSPNALQHLATAFMERTGIPELEVGTSTVNLFDLKAMLRCRVILITSNLPIAFKPAELQAIREYIYAGGTLWVNDSTDTIVEDFDKAFRASVPLIYPEGKLERLPQDHQLFNACYDLRQGFKGYRVPPGDKYRQDFIEAVLVPSADAPLTLPSPQGGEGGVRGRRAGVIYTRNDYADGLVIDARMNPGMTSLTDLTNVEMLEASLRFGMNLLAYSLGAQGVRLPPPPETSAEFEKLYRYSGPTLPVLEGFSVAVDQWQKPLWVAEKDWCNTSTLQYANDQVGEGTLLQVDFQGGDKLKAAVTRFGILDLSLTQSLVFDVHSSLARGFNMAVMFFAKDGAAYETRPLFVRPGWNRNLRFPLGLGDMKSSVSKQPWKEYDTSFEPRNALERFSILIYNLSDSGSVKIGAIRFQQ
jgi:hypothetical protein